MNEMKISVACILWLVWGAFFWNAFSDQEKQIVVQTIEKSGSTLDMICTTQYILSVNPKVPESVAEKISYEVHTQAKSIPPELIIGIIEVESVFDPFAVSKKNARGLMQILNGGDIKYDSSKIHNIPYNIQKGIEIFNEHLRMKKGDLKKALESYVGGDSKYPEQVLIRLGTYLLFCSERRTG